MDDFNLSFDKEKPRRILLDFLTFFSNVLASKDVGMTSYVIEQSLKTGVLERLLKIALDWTKKDRSVADDTISKTYPNNITVQIEKYLKDKEDQLTATWRQSNEGSASKYILASLERCLNSTVRLDDSINMELYELSVLDHSSSGLQPNSIEGKMFPITTALAEKFPPFFAFGWIFFFFKGTKKSSHE